jgi:formylglycine-generating enzyme
MPNPVRNHLFVIGINQYKSSKISNLTNAVNDAQAVIQVLQDRYGFDNLVFLDDEKATRANILGQLKTYLSQLGQDETIRDNLLVYFAGHGYFDRAYQLGYLVPCDGDIDAHNTPHNCITNDELIKMLKPIKLHQLLVVSDSCFSGGLLMDSTRKIGTYDTQEDTPEFAKRLSEKKCRWIIASALLTHASDGGFYEQNSPFAKRFVTILKQNDQKLLSSKRLLLDLEESVSEGHEQTPVGGSWKYQEDGVDLGSAFVFSLTRSKDIQKRFDACKTIDDFDKFRRDFPEDESGELYNTAVSNIMWLMACEKDTIEFYQKYLVIEPKSPFIKQALEKIDEHDWEDAKDAARDIFMNYRKKHKKGRFFQQANDLIGYISQIEKHVAPPQYIELKIEKPTIIIPKKFDFEPEMVFVKGGTFKMGSNHNEYEKPIHDVTLNDFYIGKFPVTQKQWQAVMGNNPSHFKGNNLPVEQVSWGEIQDFLSAINKKTGNKYRLPTEAEWEFAARGGIRSKGFKYAGSDIIEKVAWYDKNSSSKTHPVGELDPNELGIFDMSGNIWEWCIDVWHKNYENAPKDGSAWIDFAKDNMVRGGSWNYENYGCSVSYRNYNSPNMHLNYYGFRCVRYV